MRARGGFRRLVSALQCERMFCIEVSRRARSPCSRPRCHHFGALGACTQAMEIAAVPVSSVHHRRRKAATAPFGALVPAVILSTAHFPHIRSA
jgi:hypothetical protein